MAQPVRKWGSSGGVTTGATTGAQTWYEQSVVQTYNAVFFTTVAIAFVTTMFETGFSKAGKPFMIVNYWIGLVAALMFAYLVLHPKGPGPKLFLAVAGFNAPWNELDDLFTHLKRPDFKLKEMGEKGWEFLRTKYFVLAGHIALYIVLQSMVLATFRVTNAALVPGVMLGFVGFGLWAWLLTKVVVWYTRIVFIILFVTTGFALVGTFAPNASATAKEADEIQTASTVNLDHRNASQLEAYKAFVEAGGILTPEQKAQMSEKVTQLSPMAPVTRKLNGSSTRTVQLLNLEDQHVCGLSSGKYEFTHTPTTINVLDGRGENVEAFDLGHGMVLLNGKGHGSKVEIGEDGCAGMSYVLPDKLRRSQITPNAVIITLDPVLW